MKSDKGREMDDLTGKRFGKWLVLRFDHMNKYSMSYWLCKCDCGTIRVVCGSILKNGESTSCGCSKLGVSKKENPHYTDGDITYIYNNNDDKYCIIDTEDWDKVKIYCWRINDEGYVDTKTKGHNLRLHRLIMNTPKDMIVDHINRNPSDNRKINLRNTTQFVNAKNTSMRKNNTSGYRGVSLHKKTGKYRAYVTLDSKTIHLGLFKTIEEAVKARQEGEIKYYGERIA